MLPETHPLFDAEMFLLEWFCTSPPDQYIEYFAIESEAMKKTGLPKTDCVVAKIGTLEQSFDLSDSNQIQRWNALGYGVYFGAAPRNTVNFDSRNRAKRATGKEVAIATGAWVDIDKPHWKAYLEMEKPPATFTICSGNGCHLYFKYREAKPIAEAVEDSKALAARYEADHCFDAPRVLRIPGTVNWKDATGRTIAYLFDAKPDCLFDGVPKHVAPVGAVEASPVGSSFIDYAAIFSKIGWELKNIIMSGPEEMAKYPQLAMSASLKPDGSFDESAVDFLMIKTLVKKGLSEGEVGAVMHNPSFRISEKMLAKEAAEHGDDRYFKLTLRNASAAAVAELNRSGELGGVMRFVPPSELCKAPKLDFAVERILPIGGYCVLSGQAKAGKSLAATDLMLLMAGVEGKFLSTLKVNHHGPVGYAQAEITPSSLNTRLKAIGASHQVLWEEYPVHVFTGRANLMELRQAELIVKGLQEFKAKYFVLDPLARFHYGNENQHGDMMRVLSNIEFISRECGLLGTVVIHHHGKPGGDGGEKHGVQMMRGSTVIGDWGNAHVILQKQWTQSSGRKFIRVSMELRDAEEPEPLSLALDANLRHLPFTEADERLSKAVGIVRRMGTGDFKSTVDAVSAEAGVRRSEAEKLIRQAMSMAEINGNGNGNGNGHGEPEPVDPNAVETVEEPDVEPDNPEPLGDEKSDGFVSPEPQ
jgi:hypothetical protein